MGFLRLSIAGLTCQLDRFDGADLPRVRAELAGVRYAASGARSGRGTYFEVPHLWTVNAIVNFEQMCQLKLIYAEHDAARQDLTTADVIVDDATQLYEERLPRSRAMIAETEAIVSAAHCLYYARFKAWFTQSPRFSENGKFWNVNFALTETDKVPA